MSRHLRNVTFAAITALSLGLVAATGPAQAAGSQSGSPIAAPAADSADLGHSWDIYRGKDRPRYPSGHQRGR